MDADESQDGSRAEPQAEPPTPPAAAGSTPPPAPSLRHVVYIPYLRAWRASYGLTRAEYSARTAATGQKPISLFTFRSIESYGRPANLATATRLAAALGLTLDELLHTDPAKLPPRQPQGS